MDKFGKSQPVKRVEDVRFLTGQGRYRMWRAAN